MLASWVITLRAVIRRGREHVDTGLLEVGPVPGGDDQPVRERRSGDQAVLDGMAWPDARRIRAVGTATGCRGHQRGCGPARQGRASATLPAPRPGDGGTVGGCGPPSETALGPISCVRLTDAAARTWPLVGADGASATALQPPPHLLTTLPAPAGGGRCGNPRDTPPPRSRRRGQAGEGHVEPSESAPAMTRAAAPKAGGGGQPGRMNLELVDRADRRPKAAPDVRINSPSRGRHR